MAFRPINPYDALIQQFLGNVNRTADATERGLQAQREERLIGEERTSQAAVATTAFDRQRQLNTEDFNRQAQHDFTNQAYTMRQERLKELQDVFPYIGNDPAAMADYFTAVELLTRPVTNVGRDALNAVTRGVLVSDDGREINVFDLIGRGRRAGDVIRQQDGWQNLLFQQAAAYLSDVDRNSADRVRYYNAAVADNDDYTDEMKLQLAGAAGVRDRDTAQLVVDEGVMRQQQIAQAGIDFARATTALGVEILEAAEFERLADMNYDTMQATLDGIRLGNTATSQRMAITDLEAFMAFGATPKDPDALAALASSQGLSVDALKARGQQRYRQMQRMETYAEQNARRSVELLGTQVDMNRVAVKQNELLYNHDLMWLDIGKQAEMAEWVMAAANSGNVELLRQLQVMKDTGVAPALANVKIDDMISRAETIRENDDDILIHDQQQRELLLADNTIKQLTNRGAYLDALSATFIYEGDTIEEREQSIRDSIDELSMAQLKALGFVDENGRADPEAAYEHLSAAATTKWTMKDRSEISERLEALLKAPLPPTATAQQKAAWRANVLDMLEATGWSSQAADNLVTGILSGADLDFYQSVAEITEVTQSTAESYQRTVGQWLENQLAMGELVNPVMGMSVEEYSELRQQYTALANASQAALDTGVCQKEQPGGAFAPMGTVIMPTFDATNTDCQTAWAENQFARKMLTSLAAGQATGSGYNVDLSFLIPEEQMALTRANPGIQALEGFEGMDWNAFSSLNPDQQEVIANAAAIGTPPEEIMSFIYNIIAEERVATGYVPYNQATIPLAEAQERTDLEDTMWPTRPPEDRLPQLMNIREWDQLAADVANGKLDLNDESNNARLEEVARQFNLTRPSTVSDIVSWSERINPLSDNFMAGFNASFAAMWGNREVTDEWLARRGEETLQPDVGLARALLAQGAQMVRAAQEPVVRQQLMDNAGGTSPYAPPPQEEGAAGASAPAAAQPAFSLGTPPAPATMTGMGFQGSPPLGTMPRQPSNSGHIAQSTIAMPPVDSNASFAAYVPQADSVMSALIQQESNFRHRDDNGNLLSSVKGALGLTQVMPDTGVDPGMGVTPLRDDSEQEYLRFGRDYLAALLRRYNGDLTTALAAYNWGMGRVDAAIKKSPNNWLTTAPDETQRYVNNIVAMLSRAKGGFI